MKIDKKQLPQLIVLGVLVIICIGYLSFSVLKGKPAPPPPPAEQQATTGATDQAADDKAAKDDNVVPSGVFPDLSASMGRRDPFSPQVGNSLDSQQAPQRIHSVRIPEPPPFRSTKAYGDLMARGLTEVETSDQPLNPFKGGISPTGDAMVPVEEKDPEFVLTGVIRGEENVAIIRVGEGGRHVVRQGQLIDGRYKVLRVSDDGAVLAYKNRRIQLRLGGAKNAS